MTISKQLYANNAKTTLSSAATPSDTNIQVSNASAFPAPTAGQFFLATLESSGVIEIIKVTGVTGNTFTGCVRAQEGTTASSFPSGTRIDNRVTRDTLGGFARLVDRVSEVSSVDSLDTPLLSNANSYLCHSNDVAGNPILAIRNSDTSWRFTSHSIVHVSGSVTTSTTTSIVSSAISTFLPSVIAGEFIIQFATGTNAGLARLVTASSTNSVTWATALPNAPATGDQFEIYKSNAQITTELLNNSDTFFAIASGSGDALTATTVPSTGFALVDGKQVKVRWGATNTSTTPTININGTGAKVITCNGGQHVAPSTFQLNQEITLRYNIGTGTYEAINASTAVTPSQFDNSTLEATTGFIQRALGNRSNTVVVNTTSTLTSAMLGSMLTTFGAAGPITLTVPAAGSFSTYGVSYLIVNPTTFAITLTTTVNNFVGPLGNGTLSVIIPASANGISYGVELISDGSSWYTSSSQGLTGTAALFDNSLKEASTAFLKNAGSLYSNFYQFVSTTSFTPTHMTGMISIGSASGGATYTLPALSTLPLNQRTMIICNANNVTFQRGNVADFITGIAQNGATVTSFVANIGDIFTVTANSTGWFVESGSVSLKSYPQFANSLATSGYQKLPNGLIMQWGLGSLVSYTGTVISLPIAFPTAGLSVTISGANSNQISMNAYTLGLTGFTAIANTGSGTFAANWFALGY